MKTTFVLVPISSGAGLTTVSLGLLRALDKHGLRAGFCKPIGQREGRDPGPEPSTHFVRATSGLTPAVPIPLEAAEKLVSEGHADVLFNRVMQQFEESSAGADVMVVEGLVATLHDPHIGAMNAELIRTLGAEVIVVTNAGAEQPLREQLDFAIRVYAGGDASRIGGLHRQSPGGGRGWDDRRDNCPDTQGL